MSDVNTVNTINYIANHISKHTLYYNHMIHCHKGNIDNECCDYYDKQHYYSCCIIISITVF